MELSLEVNGRPVVAEVEPRLNLADFLRDELGLTGTHLGCEQGVCGACSVLLDGEAVRACLLLAVQASGRRVLTVEGLAADERLAAIPQAFLSRRGFQCGFCTPGFMILTAGLALAGERPQAAELRERLSANICRCTGYEAILDSVGQALEELVAQ